MRFSSFHRAFLTNLERVYNAPDFAIAPRGFASRERLNVHWTLTDPVQRVCFLPSRKTNIVFNFAEALWYLSADDTLAFISYYAKRMTRYTMDGRTLSGTAYGPRIFAFGPNRINQWERVVELLSVQDPDSKRAFIQIFSAEEGLSMDNIDVACTLGLQFFVRGRHLHASAAMRANDAFRGVVTDVFSFTFLHELMARQLGLGVGSYHHSAASFHTYNEDDAQIQRVLHGATEIARRPRFRFPNMPLGNNWPYVRIVLDFEKRLRLGEQDLTLEDLEQSGLPPYWQQVVLLFALYRQAVVEQRRLDADLWSSLWPMYQQLFQYRWPEAVACEEASSALSAPIL